MSRWSIPITDAFRRIDSQRPPVPPVIRVGRRTPLPHLKQVVLLAGSVRSASFDHRVGRSVLDLPLDGRGTILQNWQREVSKVVGLAGVNVMAVKLMLDQTMPAPISAEAGMPAAVHFERDPLDLRGTGGVLHDLARQFDDDDYLLVLSAKQMMIEPLSWLVRDLGETGADVALVSHDDGTPSGAMLVRCGALREIPSIGFIDMKEQALPKIARHHHVGVVHRPTASALPIRTLAEYIHALRVHHRRAEPNQPDEVAVWEDWRPTFSLVEQGAVVDASASLHNAVVLRGARVGARAVVARSLVIESAVVGSGAVVVDDIFAGRGVGR